MKFYAYYLMVFSFLIQCGPDSLSTRSEPGAFGEQDQNIRTSPSPSSPTPGGTSNPTLTPTGSSANSPVPSGFSATQTKQFLTTYCGSCHGAASLGGLTGITDLSAMISKGYVKPSSSAQSMLYTQILSTSKPMPPAGYPKPSQTEIDQFKMWIDQGAPIN